MEKNNMKCNWYEWFLDANVNLSKKQCILLFIANWLRYEHHINSSNVENVSHEDKCIRTLSNIKKLSEKWINLKQKYLETFSSLKKDGLQSREYVIDMHQSHHQNKKYFNNEHSSLNDFLKVLYQIRCNFFHGNKSPYGPYGPSSEDVQLICWASNALDEILRIANIP